MGKIKPSLIALMTFNLCACAGSTSSYAPVGCLGQPVIDIVFTREEAELIPETAIDKIESLRETYKARIDAQCLINYNHDKLHESD